MKWLLYIVLGILGLNLLVIIMVGIVLVSDWIRGRGRKTSREKMAASGRLTSDDDPKGDNPNL